MLLHETSGMLVFRAGVELGDIVTALAGVKLTDGVVSFQVAMTGVKESESQGKAVEWVFSRVPFHLGIHFDEAPEEAEVEGAHVPEAPVPSVAPSAKVPYANYTPERAALPEVMEPEVIETVSQSALASDIFGTARPSGCSMLHTHWRSHAEAPHGAQLPRYLPDPMGDG